MSHFIVGQDRAQCFLFPERLDDYVDKDNPVQVVDAFVEALNFKTLRFERTEPKATGRPGYDASTLLKIYIYGYLNRIPSSRRLELETRRNVEMMWLTNRLTPDHKTIAEFRKNNGKAIVAVCREFVRVCHWLSLVPEAVVVIDGSKFKAVNNRDRNFTTAKMKRRKEGIEKAINFYLAELDAADKAEPESARAKVPAIEARIKNLREEAGKLHVVEKALERSPDKQISLTDPDSRAMNTRGTAVVGYNVQTAVETTHHLIVTHEVTNEPVDRALLSPMAHKASAAMGAGDLEVLSDRGYYSGVQITQCEDSGIRTYVPKPLTSASNKLGLYSKEGFIYEREHDRYRCPAGALLVNRGSSQQNGLRIFDYYAAATTCRDCSMRAQCTRSPQARRIHRWER